MKTLIINGSPRKNGGTAALINMLKNELCGSIHIIETYYANTAPCNDCRFCWDNAKCVIDDEMQAAYRKINEADNIVIASPIYFAELTGSLLQWASRLQLLWVAKNFRNEPFLDRKPRKGGVILVDGGNGYYGTALKMGKRLLNIMEAEFINYVYFSGTDKTEPSTPEKNPEIITVIKSMADNFNNA